MKIGVLGTGVVGNTIGSALIRAGHEVRMGSRSATNEKAAQWVAQNGSAASQGSFADAAAFGEVIFNCTKGEGSLEALGQAGENNLAGKVVVDISNPLDFSKGMPPSLFVGNTDSLAEQIQKAFPQSRVVKTLNIVTTAVMVDAGLSAPGEKGTMFISGNEEEARQFVTEQFLKPWGWDDVIDLGDLTGARAMEMILPLWVRVYMQTQNPMFSWKIVRGK
ncbi:NADPH-dependent F420 reductase [Larkinella soli]|uniref:NADPH-dependent F420 reductase n=1 Tax=Larkinella soli TaxID=1770527 RepID=UPI000FFC1D8A|nr:NAD(P)-binding domain-containing protein [Larkinella soli]